MITKKIFDAAHALLKEGDHRHPGEMGVVPMGVRFSDGEVGYVTFFLSNDEGAGVDLYLYTGERGLEEYLQMDQRLVGKVYDLLGAPYREVPDIPCLSLTIAGRESLTRRERKQCRELSGGRRLLDLDGEEMWPVLRTCEPLYLETQVDDPVQIQHMEEAAVAAAWAAPRMRRGELPRERELFEHGQLLMLTPDGKSYRTERVDRPQVRGALPSLQELTREQQRQAKRVFALPHRGRLEMALCDFPDERYLTEDGLPGPQYLNGVSVNGALAAVWEGQDEELYALEDLTDREFAHSTGRLLTRLAELFLKENHAPGEIRIADVRTHSYLARWCALAGVKLVRVRELPELRDAWSEEWGEDDDEEQEELDRLDDLRDPESFLTVLGTTLELMEEEKDLPAGKREVTRHLQSLGEEADATLNTMEAADFAGVTDAMLLDLLLLALAGFLQDDNAAMVCEVAAARGYDPAVLQQMLDEDADEEDEDDEESDYGSGSGKVLPFPGLKREEAARDTAAQWEMSFDELLHGLEDGRGEDDDEDD